MNAISVTLPELHLDLYQVRPGLLQILHQIVFLRAPGPVEPKTVIQDRGVFSEDIGGGISKIDDGIVVAPADDLSSNNAQSTPPPPYVRISTSAKSPIDSQLSTAITSLLSSGLTREIGPEQRWGCLKVEFYEVRKTKGGVLGGLFGGGGSTHHVFETWSIPIVVDLKPRAVDGSERSRMERVRSVEVGRKMVSSTVLEIFDRVQELGVAHLPPVMYEFRVRVGNQGNADGGDSGSYGGEAQEDDRRSSVSKVLSSVVKIPELINLGGES